MRGGGSRKGRVEQEHVNPGAVGASKEKEGNPVNTYSDGCPCAGGNWAGGVLGFGGDVGFDTLFCVWPVGLL